MLNLSHPCFVSGFGLSARKLARSFLMHFLEEGSGKLRDALDLYQHALDSGITVSDATVSELSAMIPSLTKLSIAKCTHVTDAGLWYVSLEQQLDVSCGYYLLTADDF